MSVSRRTPTSIPYSVPSGWNHPGGNVAGSQTVDPWEYWADHAQRILDSPRRSPLQGRCGGWTKRAVAYGLFVRAGTAFDHDGDGRVSPERSDGWRETGTFLKSIGLLCHLEALGCNTIHLLPISPVGADGRKGALGSPYAITDHNAVDPMLCEPALELGPDMEFAAFVDAAHRRGFRVIQEFVLRTCARDAHWIGDHPEWVYWVREQTRSADDAWSGPTFSPAALRSMHRKVARKQFANLPVPDRTYRDRFVHPRCLVTVEHENQRWVGLTRDGERALVAGAFADWPPDDKQPLWRDVTYLRLFDAPDFDYVAYNTIRMYDRRLATEGNRVEALWDQLSGVIPSFQRRFSIDGALLDMGHALPPALRRRIVEEIRAVDPHAALWEESFTSSQETRKQGYNAVVGSFWWVAPRPERLNRWLRDLSKKGTQVPFLTAPETHNTPRAASRRGGIAYAKFSWALGCVISGVPYVHGGFELGETTPVNTGLDFGSDAEQTYPEHSLPLYNPVAYDWQTGSALVPWIKQWTTWRSAHETTICQGDAASYRVVPTLPKHMTAIERYGPDGTVLFVGYPPRIHSARQTCIRARVRVRCSPGMWRGVGDGKQFPMQRGRIHLDLGPGECWIGELVSAAHSAS